MLPKSAWMNITEKCNLRCKWCYGQHSSDRKDDMPFEQVETTLKRLKSLDIRSCILIGGEPTVHPDIAKIIATGNELGISMRMVSNGLRFSDKEFCESMVEAGIESNGLVLSMHSSPCSVSQELTGVRRSFERFSAGISNLVKLGVFPAINITLSKFTVDKVDEMIDWIDTNGLKRVAFNLGAPAVSRETVDSSFTLNPSELGEHVIRIFNLGQEKGVNCKFLLSVPFCVLPREDIDRLLAAKAIKWGCHVQTGLGMVLNVHGDLVACNHLTDYTICDGSELEKIVDKGEFNDFWNSNALTSIRKSVRVFRSDHCKECDLWGLCRGGCPIVWSGYDPSQYIKGWQN